MCGEDLHRDTAPLSATNSFTLMEDDLMFVSKLNKVSGVMTMSSQLGVRT